MLKIWNLTLVTLTFALTIFGTFLTRSGVISSVHAFANVEPIIPAPMIPIRMATYVQAAAVVALNDVRRCAAAP